MNQVSGDVDLSGYTFKELDFNFNVIPFKKVCFRNSHFIGCKFTKQLQESDFAGAHFANSFFERVTFEGAGANFKGTNFNADRPPFDTCVFNLTGAVSFVRAVFHVDGLPFYFTTIKAEQVHFDNCDIEAERFYVRFASGELSPDPRYLAIQAAEVFFSGFKVAGHFECTCGKDGFVKPPKVVFAFVNFTQMKTASMIKVDLQRARFTYANLGNVSFLDVTWPEEKGRWILFDEKERVKDAGDKERVKDAGDEVLRSEYAQLRRNYTQAFDYAGADQWYYRETECRRRLALASASKGRLAWISKAVVSSVFRLYRLVSEYGENYVRPLGLLLSVWIMAAIVYYYNGFALGADKIDYDLSLAWSGQNGWDFLKALACSAAAMMLQVGRSVTLEGTVSTVASVCQVLLTAILLPLFLFALRRKFKR